MRRIRTSSKRGEMKDCVVPKTAGFSIEMQIPAPQGEKSPIDQSDHETGSLQYCPNTKVYAVMDACIKRASSAHLPQTSHPTL